MHALGSSAQRDHRLRLCQKQLTYNEAVRTYGPKFDLKVEQTHVTAGTATSHFQLPLGLRKIDINEQVELIQRTISQIPEVEHKYCALAPVHNTRLYTEGDV